MQTSRVLLKIEEVKCQKPNPHLSSVLLVLQPYMLQFSRQTIHEHNSISYLMTTAAAQIKFRALWPGAADNLHFLSAQTTKGLCTKLLTPSHALLAVPLHTAACCNQLVFHVTR